MVWAVRACSTAGSGWPETQCATARPSRASAWTSALPRSRAMARARACWSRACRVAAVADREPDGHPPNPGPRPVVARHLPPVRVQLDERVLGDVLRPLPVVQDQENRPRHRRELGRVHRGKIRFLILHRRPPPRQRRLRSSLQRRRSPRQAAAALGPPTPDTGASRPTGYTRHSPSQRPDRVLGLASGHTTPCVTGHCCAGRSQMDRDHI